MVVGPGVGVVSRLGIGEQELGLEPGPKVGIVPGVGV